MQKKLETELMSLAHSILKLKKGDDVVLLKEKAYQIYEKLVVLTFIEKYERETPQNIKTVEELVADVFVEPFSEKKSNIVVEQKISEKTDDELVSEIVTEPLIDEGAYEDKNEQVSEQTKGKPINLQSSLEKEFGDTISLDVATDIFENAERLTPKKTINDAIIQQKNLQIDLNDRIAFVKNLFGGSQEDFNRVISQLNTMSSEKEALSFFKMIKKDYNWGGKEIYEERLLLLIERKFN